jgi:hypothetical protein
LAWTPEATILPEETGWFGHVSNHCNGPRPDALKHTKCTALMYPSISPKS